MISNDSCLTDDNASAVVDEEIIADRRARIDIDAGMMMGKLGN